MKVLARFSALTALSSVVLTSVAHAQFTYTFLPSDTPVNSEINTDFAIVGYASGSYNDDFTQNFAGPSSPTVQIVDGATINSETDTFNHSVVNLKGGYASSLVGYDTSLLNITGGDSDFVLGDDQSEITMSGGHVTDLEGQGKHISFTGGDAGIVVGNAQSDSLGSSSLGSSVVDITGGTIGAAVAFNTGIVNVRGGIIGNSFEARYGGTLNFFGSGFNATLVDPNYQNTYSLYSLSGTLASGSVMQNIPMYVENQGVSYGHSTFNFQSSAAPEPAGLALLAFSGLSATAPRLRRRGKGR